MFLCYRTHHTIPPSTGLFANHALVRENPLQTLESRQEKTNPSRENGDSHADYPDEESFHCALRSGRREDAPVPQIVEPHDVCWRLWERSPSTPFQLYNPPTHPPQVHFFRHDSISRTVDPAVAMTMGHEASGVISAIGPSVARVRPGDRVAIERGQLCRVCLPCKSGSYHLCKTMGFAADPGPPVTQGTLSKYYRIAEDFVYKVPGRCESGGGGAGGANERGGACAWRGSLARIESSWLASLPEDWNLQRGSWSETFVSDREHSAEQNAAALLDAVGLKEVETAIECSGAPVSVETGVYVLRDGGKYVQTGMGRPKMEFLLTVISEKELLVRGCFRYNTGDYVLAVSMIAKGLIDVKPMVSSTSEFEDAMGAWEKTARGEGIKKFDPGLPTESPPSDAGGEFVAAAEDELLAVFELPETEGLAASDVEGSVGFDAAVVDSDVESVVYRTGSSVVVELGAACVISASDLLRVRNRPTRPTSPYSNPHIPPKDESTSPMRNTDLSFEVVDVALWKVAPWCELSQIAIWNCEGPLCGCKRCYSETNRYFMAQFPRNATLQSLIAYKTTIARNSHQPRSYKGKRTHLEHGNASLGPRTRLNPAIRPELGSSDAYMHTTTGEGVTRAPIPATSTTSHVRMHSV
ncbi:xylitol dehydrogenase [Paraphaeosphaeria minitans]|uniref:D-xylulose reductase n=1 Tax=Paraphaeosphaeria minitans TaxID=565426 RepID=A0A9P6G739_9PLEO|nr:xylitol dehydrogenase [Paraphaeosphaeria minitans]